MVNKLLKNKAMGVFTLILAIILSLAFLNNILVCFKTISSFVSGQVDSYSIGYVIGYLFISLLLLYGIIKLFSYSNKQLYKKPQNNKEAAD
jgi:energy-converting hydrogenase Eha subunit F